VSPKGPSYQPKATRSASNDTLPVAKSSTDLGYKSYDEFTFRRNSETTFPEEHTQFSQSQIDEKRFASQKMTYGHGKK